MTHSANIVASEQVTRAGPINERRVVFRFEHFVNRNIPDSIQIFVVSILFCSFLYPLLGY